MILTNTEQLNLLLLDEIQERETQHRRELLDEWDTLEGRLPLFALYVKVGIIGKWLEFACKN